MKTIDKLALHNKSGNIYLVIDEIIDATNASKDKPMILYSNLQGRLFVRDKGEFYYKFTVIDPSDVRYIDRRKEYEEEQRKLSQEK